MKDMKMWLSKSAGMGFALGIRLKMLSMLKGMKSLIATNPQSRQFIHFGAFLNNNRKAMTARIIQPATRALFKIKIKILSIF